MFRGPLQGENLFSSLDVAGDWERKGSYHTAWSVPCGSSCSCSYAYGHGPAIGPHTGERCWPLLAGVWRAIAPLMRPWCAQGEVPNAVNLNLYRGWRSCVVWHSDDEPLCGDCGDAKLIVSVSLGGSAVFRWRRQPCPDDDDGHLCWLGHGDILVMDGRCQDEFLHRTDPGREQERLNLTFRWRYEGLLCLVWHFLFFFWVLLGVLCIWGVLALLVSLLCTRLGLLRCASCWTRPLDGGRLGHYLCNLWGEYLKVHKTAYKYLWVFVGFYDVGAKYASLSGTAQSPWLFCIYGLLD